MLYKAKGLNGDKLGASDGEIGNVKEFYFDDKYWTIRYLVADTGNWLAERKVLISPYALVDIKTDEKVINTKLTKKQIEESPSLDSDKPVSRQYEESYYGYFGWPTYWSGPYAWGPDYYPSGRRVEATPEEKRRVEATPKEKKWDPRLRSSHEVSGYHIHAQDGDIGHVDDFIIDDKTWMIRYLIVDTQNWWPGKEVLISPKWVNRVSWDEQKVFVNLNRETIKQAPEYNDEIPITRDYENRLYSHYSREGYWANEPLQKT